MGQRANDFIKNVIQVGSDVFGEKSQHMIPVLLKQSVLLTIAPIGITIPKMLSAVEFDDQAIFRIKEIDLHVTASAKRYRQFGIQTKPTAS
jgi:hypothetical protein